MNVRTNRIITPLIVVFVLVTTAPTFAGNIIYVDDDGPADFNNIQAAIDDSSDGDTIIVAEGRYFENVNFNGRNITLTSTDPCSPDVVAATIIDGSQNGSVVTFNSGEDANCVLNGFTITNGNAEYGGGIYCEASSPTIANCTFSSNSALWGGGMLNNESIPTLTNCTFSSNSAIWGGGMNNGYSNAVVVNCKFIGNSAEWGGGMLNSENSNAVVVNCKFIGNSAKWGGGMDNHKGNLTITKCMFSSNSANWGGGMNNGYSNAVVVNCKFIGNSAERGGGMLNVYTHDSVLINCRFTNNSANWGGGMLNVNESILTLSNCTFTNNSAVNSGMWGGNVGGIYALDSSVRLLNCILWGNSDINGMYESSQIYANEQIVVNYSCIQGLTGVLGGIGNIDDDPCFVEPGYWDPNGTPADANDDVWVDGDYHLLPDSPCIDAGDPNYIAEPNETDLDGNPRVIGGRIDMGAYESRVIYVDDDAAGANDGSSWDDAFNFLQDALAVAYSGDEIRVAQGIYKPDQGAGITPGDRETTFQLINGVILKGGYAGFGEADPNARDINLYGTILSGDLAGNDIEVTDAAELLYEETREENSFHVVEGSGTEPTAILDGFLVVGGQAWSDEFQYINEYCFGGGLYIMSGSPTVRNCRFIANTALSYGGGVHMDGNSVPVLVNCRFSGNSATDGGGLNSDYGSPILTGCTFNGNRACSYNADGGFGGGMYNFYSNSTLIDCTFSENSSDEWGGAGGMRNKNSSVIVTNCTFTNNSGGRVGGGGMLNTNSSLILTNCRFIDNSTRRKGGGMCNHETSNLTLANCVFIGNSAEEYGGGMYNRRSSPTLTNCTFSGNSVDYCGGGMYNGGSSGPTITNCIFWGDEPEEINIDSGTIDVTYNDIQGGWPGQGNIDSDPCFVDEANGDYRLLTTSLCIDTGDPNFIAEPNETDLDGKPRVLDGDNDGIAVVDMGAYEYRFTISAEAKIVPKTINLTSKGNWITCYIWFPEQYDVADIDPNSIFLEDEIKPGEFSVDQQKQVATATFDREKVQSILNVGDIELTITCQLTDGTSFEATDTIKVTDKAGK